MTESKRMLYTTEEVRKIFSINRNTVANWCKRGALKRVKKPGVRRVYITAESVEKFLKGV